MHKQKPGIFETLPANISCFPRRLQLNTFCLPRPLENVLKTYLQYVFLKYLQDVLQDVFKTFSRCVCKTSCNYVLKTSWKTKKCYTEDVLKTSSVRLHQDECLLGWIILNIHPAAYLEPCHVYQNKSNLYNTENSEPWHIDNPEIFRNLKYSKQHIFRTLSKIQDRVFCENS